MNSNLTGWAAVCLGVIAFKFAFTRVKPLAPKWRVGWFLLLGICGLPAALFAVYYLHVLPERAWFYELRSWRGSEFLAIPLGASAGCLATLFPRKLLGLILIFSITTAAVPYVKPLLVPLPSGALHDEWKDGACLQSTPSTCGPASIATILKHQGLDASERGIARQAFTYAGGTEAWYLARHVRTLGLDARFDFRPGLPADLKLPALVGVRLGGYGHFIPILSRKGDLLTIADPLRGMESVTLAELEKRSPLTGFHLSICKVK
jgi:hypothetical protein